jgi:hypothetical protein
MEQMMLESVWFWLLLLLILGSQSTWLFLDARKRERLPWFWALWGLIQFPLPLIFYWIFIRRGWFNRNKRIED